MPYKNWTNHLLLASCILAFLVVIGWVSLSLYKSQSLNPIPSPVVYQAENNGEIAIVNVQSVVVNSQPERIDLYSVTEPLQVHFIDVEQGDSILIQAIDGTTALIDGGPDNGLAYKYLQAHGIHRIDVMLVSHPHADHIGGLIEILHNMPVGTIWSSGAGHNTPVYEQFLDAIITAKVPYREAQRGDIIPFSNLNLNVLASDPSAPEMNDRSLVVKLIYGELSFLFMGDAEFSSEASLMRDMPEQLKATVLKVGHHGSDTSSSPSFIAAVSPEIAIYTAGADNVYGHPHETTLTTLSRARATVYGTDIAGSIVVITDGLVYSVVTEKGYAAENQSVTSANGMDAAATNMTVNSPYDPNGRDRNCGGFATQSEAQQFFLGVGGPEHDRHRLDGDNDGVACEHLP